MLDSGLRRNNGFGCFSDFFNKLLVAHGNRGTGTARELLLIIPPGRQKGGPVHFLNTHFATTVRTCQVPLGIKL